MMMNGCLNDDWGDVDTDEAVEDDDSNNSYGGTDVLDDTRYETVITGLIFIYMMKEMDAEIKMTIAVTMVLINDDDNGGAAGGDTDDADNGNDGD